MPLRLREAAAARARTPLRPGPPALLLPLLLLLACSHADPFPSGTVDDGGPFTPGLPRLLTRNGGADQYPAWLRDGSAFLYSYQDTTERDFDRCLGLMRRDGGTRLLGNCVPGDPSHASTDVLLRSAASSAGRVAWFEAGGSRTLSAPEHSALRLGALGAAVRGDSVLGFPYTAPNGLLHVTPLSLTWLGDTAVAYVGADQFNIVDCSGCVMDTVPVGRQVMILHLTGAAPSLEPIPNTLEATSVSASPDGSALYYTEAGKPWILRRTLATGAVDTVVSFGPAIVRDVSAASNRLVAIVGGQVSYGNHPQYGNIQRDAGGPLYLVNLAGGPPTLLSAPGATLRRPALSPDGTRIVVEELQGGLAPDLYLYEVP